MTHQPNTQDDRYSVSVSLRNPDRVTRRWSTNTLHRTWAEVKQELGEQVAEFETYESPHPVRYWRDQAYAQACKTSCFIRRRPYVWATRTLPNGSILFVQVIALK